MRCSQGAGWDQGWDGAHAGQGPVEIEDKTEAHSGQDHRKQKQRGEGTPH